MKYKWWMLTFLCMVLSTFGTAHASQEENKLIAVFLGRFANYIELPDRASKQFVITLVDENPFGSLLTDLYQGKLIGGKPVVIRYATRVEEIGQSDILFITLVNPKTRQEAIDYAARNSILTISTAMGFAERGGIIQLDFLQQHTRIKINHGAAVKSNIRIGAPLLSLTTVIRGDAQ
ncbi:MAG: YfiR family protein [Rhodoferax sp.]|nr:YfiR family protein [Rhodoferax sp.]